MTAIGEWWVKFLPEDLVLRALYEVGVEKKLSVITG